MFFISVGLWVECFRHNQFFVDEVVKSAYYVSIRTVWEKSLSRKIFFSIIFRTEWIFLRILMKFLRWCCRNCIIRVQANNLKKSFAFWKRCIFHHSRTVEENLLPISWVFSTQLSQLHSTGLDEHFEGKNEIFESKRLSCFSDFERNNFSLPRSFSDCLVKTAL